MMAPGRHLCTSAVGLYMSVLYLRGKLLLTMDWDNGERKRNKFNVSSAMTSGFSPFTEVNQDS